MKNQNLSEQLIDAASNGYAETVNILLNNGADINHKNSNGYTALMWAARNGHIDIVKLLINNK